MIVFNLQCKNKHGFEGWFASSVDFEHQQQSALLSCPVCGNGEVTKAMHAPYVNTGSAPRAAAPKKEAKTAAEQYTNAAPPNVEQLINYLLAHTEDVGDAFPEEARKIHYKEAAERQIRGNATHEEVSELLEEGIEVVALPIPKHRLDTSH